MSAVVLDTETTGLDAPEVVEVGYVIVPDTSLAVGAGFLCRYRPTKPITLGALATHHILDEYLIECQPSASFALPAGTEYLVGHNVDFDWKAIGSPEVRRIDTCCLARKLWPDADSHGLGAMLYLLQRSEARALLTGAHQALTDAQNCLRLLRFIVARLGNPPTWSEVWEASELARVPEVMPFGKHKGMKISEVPRDYKAWLLRQSDVDEYLQQALRK